MWGGSQIYGDEFAHFPRRAESHLFMPLNFLLAHSESHCLKNWDGWHRRSLAVPSPFLLFSCPDGWSRRGGMDQGVDSQIALTQPEKKCQKSCSPSSFWNTGPTIKNNKTKQKTHKKTPALSPKCCLGLQRHHTVIYSFAQLWIWFITESQIGTFKVRVNGQLSPPRQFVPFWMSLLTAHWRGNKFAAALVKTLAMMSTAMSCWSLCFQILAL